MKQRKVILYVRVSIIDLNIQNQLVPMRKQCELRDFKIVGEFIEHASGSVEDRPQLRKALAAMVTADADVLMVAAVDRLGRSLSHVLKLVEGLRKQGKGIVTIRENLDLSGNSPQSDLMLHVMLALAQFELEILRERTRVALAVAKLKGKKLGRPTKINSEIEDTIMEMHGRGVSTREISRTVTTVSRATVQAIIKKRIKSGIK
ncbi:hypothetical protein AZI86_07170 [Bdellovibrio bacteriovorus]|uniref:Resolvase/invertase-type recombinase catalytic domain-containing protein n=1 Tax=Bdellovibrio bacteriovorus TaxID=959 RepID=A0A150WQP6_BDEBC|nr:recombinase family protein [Bdellovibrio bacteriovorus]KYG66811.1 hypothetical protein AZI86_07170 [Bdellovibrio bacteriovorus]